MVEQRERELEEKLKKLYLKDVDQFDFVQANIPERLYRGCKIPDHDLVELDNYISLFSADQRQTKADHGLLFYHQIKFETTQAEMYATYILIKLMRKKRSAYLISTFEVEKNRDEDFIEFLCTRDILALTNFPFQQPGFEKNVTTLYRILVARFNHCLPTLFACEVDASKIQDHFKTAPPSVARAIIDFSRTFLIKG